MTDTQSDSVTDMPRSREACASKNPQNPTLWVCGVLKMLQILTGTQHVRACKNL